MVWFFIATFGVAPCGASTRSSWGEMVTGRTSSTGVPW